MILLAVPVEMSEGSYLLKSYKCNEYYIRISILCGFTPVCVCVCVCVCVVVANCICAPLFAQLNDIRSAKVSLHWSLNL